jgi:signal transduction histidine kinase
VRRVPILAKLLAAYLVPTVATFAGFGALAHWVARRSLDAELGRRLTAIAAATATQIADESLDLLQVGGDETTRTYKNVQRRLEEIRRASGARRIFVFDQAGTSRCDTDEGVAVGTPYYRLRYEDRAEQARALAGTPAASVLFRGHDDQLYKWGYAPLPAATGPPTFAVGVQGAAAHFGELARFRKTLVLVGSLGALLVIALSVLVARLITRPVKRLERAAARIGAGDLLNPVDVPSRDEIGLVAETLEQMREQLRERDERMQMMLAGIAHEVRNPLGGMELYAGLLRDDVAGDEEKLQKVARIEKELAHLKTIVKEFLAYARRERPELRTAALAEIVGEVHDLCAADAAPRRVKIELEATPAVVRCDVGQLRRALLNLVENAVQACPSDGSGRVALRLTVTGGEARLSVSDNGPGIPADKLEKIWTPFYTTKPSGTGLGLAFVRDIARDHGARLDVDSQPGRGTTFTLSLPEAQ